MFSFTALAGSVQVLDPNVSFQAVHRIGQHIVASGTNGSIYESTDNGEHWSKVTGPENSLGLQFRDIQLLRNGGLTVMSAGGGDSSRIYRTDDGKNWQLQLRGHGLQPFTIACTLLTINRACYMVTLMKRACLYWAQSMVVVIGRDKN